MPLRETEDPALPGKQEAPLTDAAAMAAEAATGLWQGAGQMDRHEAS